MSTPAPPPSPASSPTRPVGDESRPPRWSLSLGHVAGIDIRVHASFVVLVALVAAGASSTGQSVVAALGWLVVLFGCVVVHELSHSLVARRRGVQVSEIDLLPIGGVSRMEALPERWQDEAVIAAAGPAASVGIAAAAALAAVVAGVELLPVMPWGGPFLARLTWLNLLLAGFNLIPAFPLDGGRVLRAVLESGSSRLAATRQAAAISRVFAAVLVVGGLFVDLWLAIIGLFIWWAGRAEEQAVTVHAVLGPVPVERLAVPCPLVLSADARAADVLPRVRVTPQVGYPVSDGGLVVGVTTVGALEAASSGARLSTLAGGGTVAAGTSLEDAASHMEAGRPVVVVDRRGNPVGVVTPELVATYLRQAADTTG